MKEKFNAYEFYFPIDCGRYNEIIMGYLIEAMERTSLLDPNGPDGFTREQIERAVLGARCALDELPAYQAEEAYHRFYREKNKE